MSIKDSYLNGKCPDCGSYIPNNALEGESCLNCSHVFWEEYDDFDIPGLWDMDDSMLIDDEELENMLDEDLF